MRRPQTAPTAWILTTMRWTAKTNLRHGPSRDGPPRPDRQHRVSAGAARAHPAPGGDRSAERHPAPDEDRPPGRDGRGWVGNLVTPGPGHGDCHCTGSPCWYSRRYSSNGTGGAGLGCHRFQTRSRTRTDLVGRPTQLSLVRRRERESCRRRPGLVGLELESNHVHTGHSNIWAHSRLDATRAQGMIMVRSRKRARTTDMMTRLTNPTGITSAGDSCG